MLVDLPLQVDQIVAQIDQLLADDELRRRLGAAGRRTAESCWDWSVLADRTEAVYQRVLESKAGLKARVS